MSKMIKCIDGKERQGSYNSSGGTGFNYTGSMQCGQTQMKAGLTKAGWVALCHKESGDLLIPEVKYDWCTGVIHKWWDSKKNMSIDASAWSMNPDRKKMGDYIIDKLKTVFRTKPTDYKLVIFELKQGEKLPYAYLGGPHGVNYGGPCPLSRENAEKIGKTIVLAETFCGTTKEKVTEKNWITSIEIKEV
jgi:hypothetical protein